MGIADHASGTMLALYLPADVAKQLAVADGLAPADMHVTVAYTGKTDQVDPDKLRAAARQVAAREPIQATISGHARFTGGEDGDVIVALVDSPQLEQLRRDVVDALRGLGVDLPSDHGYTPHATLTYLDPADDSPIDRLDPIPVTFDGLSVVYGDEREDCPFQPPAPLAEVVREAYAHGWVLSGGPMTDRVKAGCAAAVSLAVERPDDADLLEVALHLGHLEGTWATIFERRETLHRDNLRAVLDAWRPLVGSLDLSTLVRMVRFDAGLLRESEVTEASPSDLLDRVTNALRHLLHLPDWGKLRSTVRDALTRGRAEGRADALALAAEQHGALKFDFQLAFTDAYDALANLPSLLTEADGWLDTLIGYQAADLGTTLATLTAQGTSYEDMLAAANSLLDGADPRAVSVAVDELTARALSAGALSLYASEGVEQVDFLTAGDGRVCKRCSDAEANNPYTTGNAPQPSLHPFCRCTVAARTPLSADLIAKYVS